MNQSKEKYLARHRRQKRVRTKIIGTRQRPRLAVFRSLKHIYAQIIDDETGNTLIAASTLSPELKNNLPVPSNVNAAKEVGALIARRAKERQIESVVFDRGGNLYHGRIKALADAAREEGLRF